MENLAALRAAVFSLSAKNLTGGGEINPPPVRGLTRALERGGGQILPSPHVFLISFEAFVRSP